MLYGAIVFLPLIASIIAGFFGRVLGARGSELIACIAITISAVLAVIAYINVVIQGEPVKVLLFTWIASGDFLALWSLRVDELTSVMLIVVTFVSGAVHWYSIGYMSRDNSKPRFFAYLSLFTFAMLMLVTADNFVQLFFGWEGVGLCSYFLIGFWYDRPSANAAAIKAFVVNRVGDFGFALGILAIFLVFDSVYFDAVFAAAASMEGQAFYFLGSEFDILTVITLLLFLGAMGKSAQLGLHTWLPDAMEGPTPVSALIHAATMVTAGVFLVVRCSPLFEYAPFTLGFVAIVGAATAFVAATIGLVQNDIKRVIAYSTCSQLGYMFFAVGVSAYGAAMFHLFTHAFFKALLFLGAGAVIHALDGEQDMRKMGGIYKLMPVTYVMMWIGSLSLAGIPFFSGFYSKDIIIEAAWGAHSSVGNFAFLLGVAAVAMTAFYSWRLLFLTFHGSPRSGEEVISRIHQPPSVMTFPLIFLALGAIFSGIVFFHSMVGEATTFWGESIFVLPVHNALVEAHHAPIAIKGLPVLFSLIGILLAWYFYISRTELPKRLSHTHNELYHFLLNKWYFDEVYDFLFVRPTKFVGYSLWRICDVRIIDKFGPDGIAKSVAGLARRATTLQTGYVYHYAFAMLLGVAVLVTWFFYASRG